MGGEAGGAETLTGITGSADVGVSETDEEVAAGLGSFFQSCAKLVPFKAQAGDWERFAAAWLQTRNLHPRACAGGWVSCFSSKYPSSRQPCADDTWLPTLLGSD